ncbi:MAG TPA: hypothetical protein VGG20_25190 [Thermoanaerobaculia bacterium]
MSQRNRIVLAALALAVTAALASPAPTRAAGLQAARFSAAADAFERAWTWIAHLMTGETKRPVVMQEKEGGAINPDGSTTHHLVSPTLPLVPPGSDGGGK